MNTSAMIDAMKTSISEVLEKMFFLPVDFMDPAGFGKADRQEHWIAVRVAYEGQMSGCFFLSMPVALAGSISADFLGIRSAALSEAHINETVREMINMLAGNALRAMDAGALFDLHIPSLVAVDQIEADLSDYASHAGVGIETLESGMTFLWATRCGSGPMSREASR